MTIESALASASKEHIRATSSREDITTTTLEEFKADPIGTVATNGDARAVKVTDAGGRRNDWVDAYGRVSYDDLACSDYTIIAQGPMSAREYLKAAWEAAYPVPEGDE